MRSGKGQLAPRTALVASVLVVLICDLVARRHGFWMPPVVWFFVGLSIGALCHEVAQATFAAIGSMPIRLITVGRGPLLWRGRYAETWFELRVIPIGGFVRVYPLVNYRWYWWGLFVLAGVLGNVPVICLVAELEAIGATLDKADDVLASIGFAQVLISVGNRVPVSVTVRGTRSILHGKRMLNDGVQLLRLLWQHRDGPAQLRAIYIAQLSRYSGGNTRPTIIPASPRILSLICYYLAPGGNAAPRFSGSTAA